MELFSGGSMGWLVWGCSFLVLLLLSYLDQKRSLTLSMWIKIVAVFMLCSFFVNLMGLLIPAGFIIALIYVKKKKQFYLVKALIFGLVCVVVTFYMPKFGFSVIKENKLDAQYTSEFNQVNAIFHFKTSSEINALQHEAAELVKAKAPKSEITIDDPMILFRIWVLNHRNLPIKDLDWLWSHAHNDLHFFWSVHNPNQLNSLDYIIFQDVGYMGVFKRSDVKSAFSLQAVYEFDRFKTNNPQIP
jgi:hypothetical protein